MIFVAQLTLSDGRVKGHPGRPSKKYLRKHSEIVAYYEFGKHNEYIYSTHYEVINSKLVEISDHEIHERNF